MESSNVEELRSRIAREIGHDSVLITSEGTERHFDGASFVAYYAGGLFLTFVTGAGKRLWKKIEEQSGKTGESVVGIVWDKVAKKLSGASDDVEQDSDSKQIERIKEASSGLQQLGKGLESSYLDEFLDAGQHAVETRLRHDHFSETKAKRIAAAVALEVKQRMAGGNS